MHGTAPDLASQHNCAGRLCAIVLLQVVVFTGQDVFEFISKMKNIEVLAPSEQKVSSGKEDKSCYTAFEEDCNTFACRPLMIQPATAWQLLGEIRRERALET